MQSESIENANTFLMPATYSIEFEGFLDESWSERLAGMKIRTIKRHKQPLVTIMNGRLVDQAELLGVLNALYNLGRTLRAVRRENTPEEVSE